MITTHKIVLHKDTQRKLNDKAVGNGIEHILGVNTKSVAGNGWVIDNPTVTNKELMDDSPNNYRYTLTFTATHTGDTKNKSELRAIVKTINTRATNPLGGRWHVVAIDGDEYKSEGDTLSVKDFTAYATVELPGDDDFHAAFDHLYGLNHHVNTVLRSLKVAEQSSYENRYHVALIGRPGCGKSDICETLAALLGDDAVMKFDATATTAAGAIKQLDEAEILPRVMVVEEIEKVTPDALLYLMSLMDMRAEIRKTTARSKIVKDTKILVIATVNNYELLEKIHAGAIWSRFARKAWFKRPSEEVMRMILRREIAKLDGDEAWIDPVIAYVQEKNIDDPRMVTALCLTGQDGWLDGTFVRELAETDKPQDY